MKKTEKFDMLVTELTRAYCDAYRHHINYLQNTLNVENYNKRKTESSTVALRHCEKLVKIRDTEYPQEKTLTSKVLVISTTKAQLLLDEEHFNRLLTKEEVTNENTKD